MLSFEELLNKGIRVYKALADLEKLRKEFAALQSPPSATFFASLDEVIHSRQIEATKLKEEYFRRRLAAIREEHN